MMSSRDVRVGAGRYPAGVGRIEKGRARAALRQVVFVGFNRVGNMQAQVAELRAQGLPGNPQQEGGPVLVPAGVRQDAGEQEPVEFLCRSTPVNASASRQASSAEGAASPDWVDVVTVST